MEKTILGRTGLCVSRMGLGCGGHSRLGISYGNSEAEAERVVHEALDLGINFIDTAESYRTEEIVGRALTHIPRDRIVLSTKAQYGEADDRRSNAQEFRARAEGSLKRLRTDYVDVFHVHGVLPQDYDFTLETILPVMFDLQAEGKIRFIGITEAFGPDPTHQMLARATEDDCWEIVMVGFNILNQSARRRILPWAHRNNVGTLGMFAVRRALSHPEMLPKICADLAATGEIDGDFIDLNNPLGFLVAEGVAASIPEAAYRFCLWEPGIHVVLSGTGNVDHLRQNAEWLSKPPLPAEVVMKLNAIFAAVDSIAGN